MIAQPLQVLRRQLNRSRSRDSRQTSRDRALTRRLYTTFETDLELADVQGIQFYVQSGVVTLYGTVRHELDREMLVSLVRDIAGVQGVVAHLQLVESRFQDATSIEGD